MNLQQSLTDYLSLRRSLGFKLHSDGIALVSFVAFMEKNRVEYITTELAICWATKMTSSSNTGYWGSRLCIVRGFANYLRSFDSRTEIPPAGLFRSGQRPMPYLFTDIELRRLVIAAGQLHNTDPFLKLSLSCLFGLLSVTGLRIGEALNLIEDNIDLESGLLTITGAKFGKTRLIPIHATTQEILIQYQNARQEQLGRPSMDYWFINQCGKRLGYDCIRYHFHKLLKQLKIYDKAGHPRPRLHDLRHYFAVSTLTRWYHQGVNVDSQLPVLSAFLGHVETRDTYWYISACPNLMNAAKARLEEHWEANR